MIGIILAIAITALVGVLAVITLIAPDNHYGGNLPSSVFVAAGAVLIITWFLAL